MSAVIIAADTVSEDAIYTLCADIFDNAADLTDSHAKYAELSVENGASITSVPYHPGAAKYFKEKGFEVETKKLRLLPILLALQSEVAAVASDRGDFPCVL